MKNTEEKILEKTFLLMVEMGYDNVRVSDIQNALGISRGLLYRYFSNMDELVFAACRKYFFDGYLNSMPLKDITLRELIYHIHEVQNSLICINGTNIDILKYNTLYSCAIMREPKFKLYALGEFSKAVIVIRNAIKRGEIKNLPVNFIGATLLSILGRTTYISETPTDDYIRRRIKEDIERFYELIKV